MPIEFTCPHCQSLLRVDDANAGKRARCPHCSVINRIPGEKTETRPETPVSHQFFIDSVSGETYGPVTKKELDAWVAEGRVSAACSIRATGQKFGQPASVYYPALADQSTSAERAFVSEPTIKNPNPVPAKPTSGNPFAAPTPVERRVPIGTTNITPTQIDLGEVFTHAYQVFTQNMGLLVAAAVVCIIPQAIANVIDVLTQDRGNEVLLIAWPAMLVLNLIHTYLVIGQYRIALRLVRGQQAEFGELFSGGDKFLPIIGFSILIFIPLLIGFLLLIVPFVFMLLYFWPSYSLIIDNKAKVFESFGIAAKIGEVNLLNSFVLGLASVGIILFGLMLCCVGVIFASGYVSVLWAVAYLMMSGQVSFQPIKR